MLVQDSLTGYLHEVPDQQLYEVDPAYLGEVPDYQLYESDPVVYDGFGSPMGFAFLAPLASALAPMAAKALPGIASKIIPGAAQALPGILRGITGAASSLLPAAARAASGAVQAIAPVAAGAVQNALAPTTGLMPFRPPVSFPAPMPPNWVRPPVPYTGLQPRRFYMRCAAWPGPRGLVPATAATMAPGVVAPGVVPTGVVAPVRAYRPRRRRR